MFGCRGIEVEGGPSNGEDVLLATGDDASVELDGAVETLLTDVALACVS